MGVIKYPFEAISGVESMRSMGFARIDKPNAVGIEATKENLME